MYFYSYFVYVLHFYLYFLDGVCLHVMYMAVCVRVDVALMLQHASTRKL